MSLAVDSRNQFARQLVAAITKNALQQRTEQGVNVVISPASIQSCLTLAFMAASGTTAEELRQGLHLGPGDSAHIARSFGEFWTSSCNYGAKGPVLKSVNRLYVNETLELQPEFNAVAGDFFQAKAEPVKFADALAVTEQINAWVKEQTDDKIRELLQSDAVNQDTSAVLINALYFKGKWRKPFMPETTQQDDFSLNLSDRIKVDMMYQEDKFKYAELPHLQARAVQLPYEHSNISMLILLPDTTCGILELEQRLQSVDLADIEAAMTLEDVDLALPKLTLEFDVDLKEVLLQLGISEIFGNEAKLDRLFTTKTGQKLSAARHRGYISINEAGSEAAAATFMKIVPMSLNMQTKAFRVDHPFLFYIRSCEAVFFAGRVVSPSQAKSDTSRASLSQESK
ncbi:LOW QUALITY PROTEIN: serine protease inhibitor 42Dd [Drosophila subobscura]|uniref:LOW QUALITY PROTEIN: serine protease inhibitor 42Dd n=1 Tax=Drosophila subobscura TaxID=7241 RepID=UPI00155A3C35|nr:LOW QUALITY PROTEIN: serine protease inhibitor 42Dd [Drosophila subobscura]